MSLWGLDAIKTKGESVGVLLALVGARPVKEGTGRIARFELVPLSELGRPRVDVLANMSGIFRDSFVNVVELLDDMFQKAGGSQSRASSFGFWVNHYFWLGFASAQVQCRVQLPFGEGVSREGLCGKGNANYG